MTFSTIRVGTGKAHIFDHETQSILCGLNRWNCTPFKINKREYNAVDMCEHHHGFSERRAINSYKYTCQRCEHKIERLYDIENITIEYDIGMDKAFNKDYSVVG